MQTINGRPRKEDEEQTPAFTGADGREIQLAESKRMSRKKVEEAGLGEIFIKGHSLRIFVATAYANSPEGWGAYGLIYRSVDLRCAIAVYARI